MYINVHYYYIKSMYCHIQVDSQKYLHQSYIIEFDGNNTQKVYQMSEKNITFTQLSDNLLLTFKQLSENSTQYYILKNAGKIYIQFTQINQNIIQVLCGNLVQLTTQNVQIVKEIITRVCEPQTILVFIVDFSVENLCFEEVFQLIGCLVGMAKFALTNLGGQVCSQEKILDESVDKIKDNLRQLYLENCSDKYTNIFLHKTYKKLSKLTLKNSITPNIFNILPSSQIIQSKLKHLNLNENNLTKNGLNWLIKCPLDNLEHLSIENCKIDCGGRIITKNYWKTLISVCFSLTGIAEGLAWMWLNNWPKINQMTIRVDQSKLQHTNIQNFLKMNSKNKKIRYQYQGLQTIPKNLINMAKKAQIDIKVIEMI